MQLLYKGKYEQRFEKIIPLIKGNSVTELCFGDTYIAEYCKAKNIQWKGIDLNPVFIEKAKEKGFDVMKGELKKMDSFPKAETFLMMGSLYHFHADLGTLLDKILQATSFLIISEPIDNIAGKKGFISKLAGKISAFEGENQDFRFDKNSLLQSLESLSLKLNFTFKVMEEGKKDWLILIEK